MVIPFLSLYLTEGLDFTLGQVGWVMSSFGLGSMIGTWIGGQLTDRFGNFKVMTGSLLGTGLLFILLQFVSGFWMWCLSIFVIMCVTDAFRPAMFVALRAYSKPENRTRSVTLIRLAINLGFSAGPAMGGWIILTLGYAGLFWVDGITCLLAVVALLVVLNPRRTSQVEEEVVENAASAYSDRLYWVFFMGMALFSLAFMQYFSTMPLYYSDVYALNEGQIGLIMGLNGLLIFLFEMPLIKYLEDRTFSIMTYIVWGGVLLALSFLVIVVFHWVGILILGMILMTFGEMLAFPFSNAFAMQRSERGRQGQYMAMYSMAFSFASIFGHNMGLQSVEYLGYSMTWSILLILVFVSAGLFYWVKIMLKNEKS